jgi:hypothetical protein
MGACIHYSFQQPVRLASVLYRLLNIIATFYIIEFYWPPYALLNSALPAQGKEPRQFCKHLFSPCYSYNNFINVLQSSRNRLSTFSLKSSYIEQWKKACRSTSITPVRVGEHRVSWSVCTYNGPKQSLHNDILIDI